MAEWAELDIMELMEEEKKAEKIVEEARRRAEEIVKQAEEEAKRIVEEAEKSKEPEEYKKVEYEKLLKELKRVEEDHQKRLDRLKRIAERNLDDVVKFIMRVVLYGEEGS